MALTDTKIKNVKPQEKRYKSNDSEGLSLLVNGIDPSFIRKNVKAEMIHTFEMVFIHWYNKMLRDLKDFDITFLGQTNIDECAESSSSNVSRCWRKRVTKDRCQLAVADDLYLGNCGDFKN